MFLVVALMVAPLNLLHCFIPPPLALSQPAVLIRNVLRSRVFWTLWVAHFFMTMTMVNVHLAEFLSGTTILTFVKVSFIAEALSLVSLPGRMFSARWRVGLSPISP